MTRIQELIQEGKIEIAHNDGVEGLRIYNMDFAKQNIEEIKASKPEIMEYLKIEKAKEEEEEERIATEKATITFLVPGWETSEGTKREIERATNQGIPVFSDLDVMEQSFLGDKI